MLIVGGKFRTFITYQPRKCMLQGLYGSEAGYIVQRVYGSEAGGCGLAEALARTLFSPPGTSPLSPLHL